MELIDIVKREVKESESVMLEARDRLHFVSGWNAACKEILARASASAEAPAVLQFTGDVSGGS